MLGHTLLTDFSTKTDRYDVYGTVRNSDGLEEWLPQNLSNRVFTQVDAFRYDSIVKIFGEVRPNVVINCIGIIKQLGAAKDPLVSIPINALFPHQLAALCQAVGARLIHISTDCVFSGRQGNYREGDNPDPLDLYGRTKLLGEVSGPGCLTLRTSIIGRELKTQSGLIEWFLSQEGKTVKGFAEAIYSGFTTKVLADIIMMLIEKHPEMSGLWHVSSDQISKYDLLQLVKQTFKLDITIKKDETFICNRSLNSSRFRAAVDYTPPTWQEMITQLAHDLEKNYRD